MRSYVAEVRVDQIEEFCTEAVQSPEDVIDSLLTVVGFERRAHYHDEFHSCSLYIVGYEFLSV